MEEKKEGEKIHRIISMTTTKQERGQSLREQRGFKEPLRGTEGCDQSQALVMNYKVFTKSVFKELQRILLRQLTKLNMDSTLNNTSV